MNWRWDYASQSEAPLAFPSLLWGLLEAASGVVFMAGVCFAGWAFAGLVEALR